MGDAAIDVVLNSIETVLNGESNLIYRHQIQHNSVVRPDQIERYKQLEILASVRGYWNTCEAEWYENAFGEDHYAWNANRFALVNLGIHTFTEGDFSRGDIFDKNRCNPLNPLFSLYGFVTHQQVNTDGSICQPPEWIAKQKISIERGLEMVTIEPAFAVSLEEYIGSVKPGKYADLIILSDDPLTMDPNEIINLKVWMTMVNGEVKYCADGQEAYCPAAGKTVVTFMPTIAPTTIPTVMKEEVPQTVQVKYDCDVKSTSPSHFNSQQFLLTNINWAAATEEQLNDFLEAIKFSIYVNDRQIQSSLDHGEIKPRADGQTYSVLAYFDVGKLQPGKYEIRTVLTFSKKIYDGYDFYGPGTKNPTVEGTCTVIIE